MAGPLQGNRGNTSATTTLNIAYSSPVTPGSLLTVCVGSSAGGRTFTASDTVNGAWNVDLSPGQSQGILSFPNTAAGTPTVTITISGAAATFAGIIDEWPGIQLVSPKDKTSSLTGGPGTSGNTGTTATMSQPGNLCLAMMSLGSGSGALPFAVAGPDFTADPFSPAPNSSAALVANGYFINPGTAGEIATFNWTASNSWRGLMVTYLSIPSSQPYLQFTSSQFFVADKVKVY